LWIHNVSDIAFPVKFGFNQPH